MESPRFSHLFDNYRKHARVLEMKDLMERLDKIQGWLEESHDRVSGTENSAAAESFLDNAKAEIELDIEHFRRPDVPSMVMVTTTIVIFYQEYLKFILELFSLFCK